MHLHSVFSEKQRRSLSQDVPAPLYFQLYKLLKSCILNGTFSHGSRLPTEMELSSEFSVSRITAKRSLDELAQEGLVTRHRGKGTHVTYKYQTQPVRAPLEGVLEEIDSLAQQSSAIVLDCELLHPPRQLHEEFAMADHERALYLARVRHHEGMKFAYYRSWTPNMPKPDNPAVLEETPRLTYFKKQGMQMTHVRQRLGAVAADQEAAEALDIDVGAPLLRLTRRIYDREGTAEKMVDYLKVLYHHEYFQYRMDLTL
jgi:GntR family transcriptional regulator